MNEKVMHMKFVREKKFLCDDDDNKKKKTTEPLFRMHGDWMNTPR